VVRVFGELHFISLGLHRTMENLLDECGEFARSKALRVRTRDQMEKTGHEDYMDSIYLVALSHKNLGE
jgi:hypothetical protein